GGNGEHGEWPGKILTTRWLWASVAPVSPWRCRRGFSDFVAVVVIILFSFSCWHSATGAPSRRDQCPFTMYRATNRPESVTNRKKSLEKFIFYFHSFGRRRNAPKAGMVNRE